MENVWGYIKKEIAKKRPHTQAELEQNLQKLWNGLSNEYLGALVAFISKRVKLIKAKEGDRVPC